MRQNLDANGVPSGSPFVSRALVWDGPTFSNIQANQVWTYRPGQIRGGTAIVNWSYNGVSKPPYRFCIRAFNPSSADAQEALDPPATQYWFKRNIPIHENNMSNFCEPGRMQQVYCSNLANAGLPVWGAPEGYGLMQLDPPAQLSEDAQLAYDRIWNWRANVTGGESLLTTKYNSSEGFWNSQVIQWLSWNETHNVPPPDDQYESTFCTFGFNYSALYPQGSPHENLLVGFAAAIAMKQMAGATNNYISWDNQPGTDNEENPHWQFYKSTNINANIVRSFCRCRMLHTCEHN